MLYSNGEGTPQNYQAALKWYKASAEQGYTQGQFNLALMYVREEGAPQDYKSAHMWWSIAAASDHAGAAKNRDKVADMMTAAELSEAQQMASDWLKAHP